MSTLEDLVKELPPDLRQEVEDFARYLVEKHIPAPRKPMRFTWVGALADLDPGAERATRSLPYFALHQVGFTSPPVSRLSRVRSYRTFSPLPAP